MKKKKIPTSVEAAMLALLINGEKYGRELRDEYKKRYDRTMPYGTLYTTLDRMEKKGFLRSWLGESCHERGGYRRKYYEITADGRAALDEFGIWTERIRACRRSLTAATWITATT